jgi:hypothetical protein
MRTKDKKPPKTFLQWFKQRKKAPYASMTLAEEVWKFYEATVEELNLRQASFDLRWKADMRAIKLWQKAHPGKELTWPDQTDLVVWLLETYLPNEKQTEPEVNSRSQQKRIAAMKGEPAPTFATISPLPAALPQPSAGQTEGK